MTCSFLSKLRGGRRCHSSKRDRRGRRWWWGRRRSGRHDVGLGARAEGEGKRAKIENLRSLPSEEAAVPRRQPRSRKGRKTL
jgi:hypothetical protein